MQTLNHWAYNGDRLWTSHNGQHTDYGHVTEAPPHPKSGDVVHTDKGAYRLGEPLMQESSSFMGGALVLLLFVVLTAAGLAYKYLTA